MAYGEVQGKTWRSPSIRGLNDSQKLAWPYVLSNKHSNMMGYYELPLSYMADDLEWSVEKTKKVIETLEGRGIIAYDHATQVVFICKYLKYNRLSSGARETGAITRLHDIPESPLLCRLSAAVKEWHPQLVQLRSYLEEQESHSGLFEVHEESTRSPRGLIDIDKDRVTDKGQGKEKGYSSDFEEFWDVWKSLKRAVDKVGAWKAWNTTLKGRNGDGSQEASSLIFAARNYQQTCKNDGTESKYIMHAATFLGPGLRWADFKEAVEPVKTSQQEHDERDERDRKWAEEE